MRSPKAVVILDGADMMHFLGKKNFDEKFAEKMHDLRWRIIREFVDAKPSTKFGTRRDRTTCGYFANLDDNLTSLANYLAAKMGPRVLRRIYSVNDLPWIYRRESQKDRETVVGYVCYELIMRQLVMMQGVDHVYYLQGWNMPPSVMDEYRLMFKNSQRSYRNEGSWHGRPNRDRFNGTRPGTSVGNSR